MKSGAIGPIATTIIVEILKIEQLLLKHLHEPGPGKSTEYSIRRR
jgi:hypothetical protein